MATTGKKIILVTGGNNGIGLAAVDSLFHSPRGPYHVLMGSRSMSKAKSALAALQTAFEPSTNTVEALELDLTSDKTIEEAYNYILTTHGRIDCLINNAGVNRDLDYVRGLISPRQQFQETFDVNVSGTHVVTQMFAPLLLRSPDPRLIFVSGLASLTKQAEKYFPTPELSRGWPKKVDFETVAYKCSKVALSMLMLDWKHKLKADGVKVWALGPGMCVTDLGGIDRTLLRQMGAKPASIAGDFIRDVVEGGRDNDQGKIVSQSGVVEW